MTIVDTIKEQLTRDPVVLYMKGTPDFPQCGFSARVVHILRECDVDFVSYDVLEDPELRQGIKDYGNWPTIPQLYLNGELVGGSDILAELFETGELQEMLKEVE